MDKAVHCNIAVTFRQPDQTSIKRQITLTHATHESARYLARVNAVSFPDFMREMIRQAEMNYEKTALSTAVKEEIVKALLEKYQQTDPLKQTR